MRGGLLCPVCLCDEIEHSCGVLRISMHVVFVCTKRGEKNEYHEISASTNTRAVPQSVTAILRDYM